MDTSTTGTGTITLGSAVSGYLTFADAGVSDGDVVSYSIEDGSNREVGTGTYTSSGTTLTRTVTDSTNAGSAINLSGSAEVYVNVRAEDLVGLDAAALLGEQITPLAPHQNLAVINDGTNPNYQMDITADEITLFDGTSRVKNYSSVSETVDITSSGVDGLDTGSEASSTWYYIWIISKEDDTVASLLSTSATAPTMPTDYVYKGLVGAVYNNSSSNFDVITQTNNHVARASHAVVSAGTATSITSVSLTGIVPPNARVVSGWLLLISSTASARYVYILPRSTDGGNMAVGGNLSGSNWGRGGWFRVPIPTSQTVYYRVTGSSCSGYVYLSGWEY